MHFKTASHFVLCHVEVVRMQIAVVVVAAAAERVPPSPFPNISPVVSVAAAAPRSSRSGSCVSGCVRCAAPGIWQQFSRQKPSSCSLSRSLARSPALNQNNGSVNLAAAAAGIIRRAGGAGPPTAQPGNAIGGNSRREPSPHSVDRIALHIATLMFALGYIHALQHSVSRYPQNG